MEKLYSPADVAVLTGLKRATIARWFREGQVKDAMKIGQGKQAPWYGTAKNIMECLVRNGWKQESPFDEGKKDDT